MIGVSLIPADKDQVGRPARNEKTAWLSGNREERCLENFYLHFNPLIHRTQVYELADRHFYESGEAMDN
jgi:hypothetical protein